MSSEPFKKLTEMLDELNDENYETQVDKMITYIEGVIDSTTNYDDIEYFQQITLIVIILKRLKGLDEKIKKESNARISEDNNILAKVVKLQKLVEKLEKKSLR